ncbi:hypothetical protein LB557_30670 [Mesorhizobium sp. BR115XR7A]|uniref:hypothetical protein n=1 Tax=unclassified Mesorhizobium TaxID=325217 RepID=UPI001CCFD30A|nr:MULTISPECIES: hypothetical protein [unclassified Mesorhizobium]MBZ9724267.1 hypothetical protein [Mesorhizobium sp. CO1-1-11]MBZ9910359.1 hypothetical protein [Mesorhizobium sp. BR115XR7A]MBZ9929418.1 hypothetical protein [Mesorhizobium sp. BR1-1-5]
MSGEGSRLALTALTFATVACAFFLTRNMNPGQRVVALVAVAVLSPIVFGFLYMISILMQFDGHSM